MCVCVGGGGGDGGKSGKCFPNLVPIFRIPITPSSSSNVELLSRLVLFCVILKRRLVFGFTEDS